MDRLAGPFCFHFLADDDSDHDLDGDLVDGLGHDVNDIFDHAIDMTILITLKMRV